MRRVSRSGPEDAAPVPDSHFRQCGEDPPRFACGAEGIPAHLWQTHRVDAGFQCAGCGEWNPTSVDAAAGRRQSYIEDCHVCCKPNVLEVRYDAEQDEFVITAELE